MTTTDFHGLSYALTDRREAAPADRPAAPSSPSRPGYSADGQWRPITDDERVGMSIDERLVHAHRRPGQDEERARARDAAQMTSIREDSDWRERRIAEQAAVLQRGG